MNFPSSLNALWRDKRLISFNRALGHAFSTRVYKIALHFGLQGESRKEIFAAPKFLNRLDIDGVKRHNLHVVNGTALEKYYQANTVAPQWSINTLGIHNVIFKAPESRDTWQGRFFPHERESLIEQAMPGSLQGVAT
jgi:radical SAM superfamily enzyme